MPAVPAARPDPIPFDAVGLRDKMNNARFLIEQMGGLLDRLADGSTETCGEYNDYYRRLTESSRYGSIPENWHGVYNEYIFAIENTLTTNDGIYTLCQEGGGQVGHIVYGNSRQGINQSLDRLIPAIETANGLLGG